MAGILVSLLASASIQMLKYAITAAFEARKLRRPNIRDKEGTRQYLENLLKWIAYLQNWFFGDLKTPAFTLGILLEIVKSGPQWDAFYSAIIHDFNVSEKFPPDKYAQLVSDSGFQDSREGRIGLLCLTLRGEAKMEAAVHANDNPSITQLEMSMAEEYLAVVRRILDHPAVLGQAQATYRDIAK